jgi:small subunit ribosomal protein S18
MARRTPPRRNKSRDSVRRGKKKVSPLTIAKVDFVDYKDTEMLRKFVSERSKLKTRRVTGNDEQQQREVARAVKNAREMALIPYTNRVTTQRRERRSDDRSARADGPPPRPTAPPPGSGDEVTDEELEAVEAFELVEAEATDESVEAVETIEAEATELLGEDEDEDEDEDEEGEES